MHFSGAIFARINHTNPCGLAVEVADWFYASAKLRLPLSLDVPRTEILFQERATFFRQEQIGYSQKRYSNRDSACALEPTGRVAGRSASFHAGFTYVDALT